MLRLVCLLIVIARAVMAAEPPLPRPAAAADPEPRPVAVPAGMVCGDPALTGSGLPPVVGEGECGIAAPVRLEAAGGAVLDPAPVVACDIARALAVWIAAADAILAERGVAVAGLAVVDAYSCRNRNRAAEGRLSEHGFGRAIDIAALHLDDGATVSVLDGWISPEWGALLHRLHAAACGPFATVLGPEANPLHADHLHFDTAARRRPWCE